MDGFLGTRASFMLDVVFVAMFAIIPTMFVSIYLVKFRRMYLAHKIIQLVLGGVLLVAVSAFELEQVIYGWEARAEPSPYFDAQNKWSSWAGISLFVHLLFAIPSVVLWAFVIVQALRHFPSRPVPSGYSRSHVFWARLAAMAIIMTAVTGWAFYWLAFVAG